MPKQIPISQLLPVLSDRGVVYMTDIKGTYGFDKSGKLAADAAPALFTPSNAGIPAWMANFINPEVIDVIFSPMRAVEVAGGREQKHGDFTTLTEQFRLTEPTGNVSSYDDYSNDGSVGSNTVYEPRQSYTYQTFVRWGEREVEMASKGQINQIADLERASLMTMNKFQNKSYLFGIAGLQNYGTLNDPNLLAAIAPPGGTTWAGAEPEVIANAVTAMFAQLAKQTQGWVDQNTKMRLVMSPELNAAFLRTNQFGLSGKSKVEELYPNMEFISVPEYSAAGVNTVQLIADDVNGQKTMECAFTERMRAHPVIPQASSFAQKRSAGTWGTIIYQPVGIVTMVGA